MHGNEASRRNSGRWPFAFCLGVLPRHCTHKEVNELPREGNNDRRAGLLQYQQRRALLR